MLCIFLETDGLELKQSKQFMKRGMSVEASKKQVMTTFEAACKFFPSFHISHMLINI